MVLRGLISIFLVTRWPVTILLHLKKPLQNVLEIYCVYSWSPEGDSCWLWWPPSPDLLCHHWATQEIKLADYPEISLSTFTLSRGWSLYIFDTLATKINVAHNISHNLRRWNPSDLNDFSFLVPPSQQTSVIATVFALPDMFALHL